MTTNTVDNIERQIEQLPAEQLKMFRSWYEQFDSKNWDHQIENDIRSGKLDAMAKAAIADHRAGRTKAL